MDLMQRGSTLWWTFFFRGTERILISMSGTLTIYLGYQLYKFGISAGQYQVLIKGDYGKIAVSGVGPGLLMILFGALILIYAMHKNVKSESTNDGDKTVSVITNALQTIVKPTAQDSRELDSKSSQEDVEEFIANYKGKDPVPILQARIKELKMELEVTKAKVNNSQTEVRESEPDK